MSSSLSNPVSATQPRGVAAGKSGGVHTHARMPGQLLFILAALIDDVMGRGDTAFIVFIDFVAAFVRLRLAQTT
eukprot:SAG31_NODE_23161_length_510_cov_0.618005_1_plen_73_part_01